MNYQKDIANAYIKEGVLIARRRELKPITVVEVTVKNKEKSSSSDLRRDLCVERKKKSVIEFVLLCEKSRLHH